MPAASNTVIGQKRKRASGPSSKIALTSNWSDSILKAEQQISKSQKHYNEIARILEIAKTQDSKSSREKAAFASVSLCRVFCRLISNGSLGASKESNESRVTVIAWLKQKLTEYEDILLKNLRDARDAATQESVLNLYMLLVKHQVKDHNSRNWKQSSFPKLFKTLLKSSPSHGIATLFTVLYFSKFHDVQFNSYWAITNLTCSDDWKLDKISFENAFIMLSSIESIPTSKEDISSSFVGNPSDDGPASYKISEFKKQAQQAWLALFSSNMDNSQRKCILRVMVHGVIPWFANGELLMDFLTDSYDIGGSMSLLALSGLFHLIQEKNLDYPSFYPKLYSLLDEELLHSKHRSRFFRLLDTFMSSTHLPAVLVASFIKRLSRLAIHAPPAGIVAVIPWVYNMLKKHPACTFMIHRECLDEEECQKIKEYGVDDPFDMNETDPMETKAIDSSLWEIATLQSHYHPNVATLAKIISEPFTKQSYNLEDFLDYSYASIIEGDLRKELKRPPVIEVEIPKRIFTSDEGLSNSGKLLEELRAYEKTNM